MEVVQTTQDVTDWATYFAPDDDIHGVLLAALKAAPDGTIVTSSQYGFTDTDVAAQFGRLGSNPQSRFLFDKTQAAGTKEKPILQVLVKNLQASQWAIGTSKKAHQILHTKAVVLTYPTGPAWSMTGSFNFSASAESQFNIVDVIVSPSRGALFRKMIEAMFDWVKTNEGSNQP
jgi:hypothetical protein